MFDKLKVVFVASVFRICLSDVGVLNNLNATTIIEHFSASHLDSKLLANDEIHTQPIDNGQERTLLLFKPDALQRKLVGKVIERFENANFKLVGMKTILANRQVLEEHYSQHKNRTFFNEIVEYMSSGAMIPMVWEGTNIINITRKMIGNSNPRVAERGTIRGDFGNERFHNIIHGSDSIAAAHKEIDLWFQSNEIISPTIN